MTLDNFIAGLEILKKYLPSKGSSKYFVDFTVFQEFTIPITVTQCQPESLDGQTLLQLEFNPSQSTDGFVACWAFSP